MIKLFSLCLLVLLFSKVYGSAILAQEFDTDNQLKRYQRLNDELRCLKCLNHNLADSNSDISVTMRNEVARMIKAGSSDKEIKAVMVARYGDMVLYLPPVQKNTYVLWAAPAVMFGAGLLVFGIIVYRRSHNPDIVNDEAVEMSSTTDSNEENIEK